MPSKLPIAVIGAGPVGLAAAAQLMKRGLRPLVLESGPSAGTSLRAWGHVRVFSPWRYVIENSAAELLHRSGWIAPDPEELPTGAEIVERYLDPLARLAEIAPHVAYGSTVTAVTRENLDKVTSRGRGASPFVIRYVDASGEEKAVLASAVLDASGTWRRPSPMGVDGLPVIGESKAGGRIAYGIPDVSGVGKPDYAAASILVVGSGHSAINVVLALLEVQKTAPTTAISWALRRNGIDRLLGGGLNDQLPARGDLGLAAKEAIDSGRVKLLAPFAVQSVRENGGRLDVEALHDGRHERLAVDRIVVATGFRPDLDILKELRLDLDPAVEAPHRLAPMIDPNLHSCGTVPPHGVVELTQPEPGFFIVGSKSYGRAPTFLMATGYEQVRSVVAELAGDSNAAREVHLVLPETGVCSVTNPVLAEAASGGCCGGPALSEVDACCIADMKAKTDGKAGCGCGTSTAVERNDVEPAE
ncbi:MULTISPECIES: FAD-dependent oxidoreductase [Rhizobium/Agrobacterium group]|uniref:FAD-dependent oxidoreductase n=1 Tax=Neorhizobium petrolearium TaxID=515361 RepID=A0ABY8M5I5_9HYPH|nr:MULTISPECIES: FAD-dependent oxidoreductase [Rhizobium/Agrobacterium group]KGD99494.1 flavoprotein [Rhizobium sp. YS-1r]MCC2609595.1 NAD(P)-binding domain-containing protein [Neorhizobium petrolearium]WGI69795.1 FAD-dependent oxidoreductase [Neorhizobium petrolearium]